ncbi:hypothetical protein NQZ79_g2262 [Umbelopsis isabellina]|nr:hypothetical protein NQZ79_g2262 [Umbelopsis isabellina]
MSSVPGLRVIHDFVSPEEEAKLVENCDQQTWSGLGVSPNPELKRRTQQYGHLFSYQYRIRDGPCGPHCRSGAYITTAKPSTRQRVRGWTRYHATHSQIDAPSIFGPVIMSLSLLSPCVMQFTHCETGQKFDICLPRRSLVVMTDEARYNYKHSISKDLIETLSDGTIIERSRRISFTFRNIISFTGECSK